MKQYQTSKLRHAFTALALSASLIGCGNSGSTDNGRVGSDTETRNSFSDLKISGLGYTVNSGDRLVTEADGVLNAQDGDIVTLYIGDIELGTVTINGVPSLHNAYLNELPVTSEELIKEVTFKNDVTGFDKFVNAVTLMRLLDQDAYFDNGISLDNLDTQISNYAIRLDVPMDQFLEQASVLELISSYGTLTRIRPSDVISDLYDVLDIKINYERITSFERSTNIAEQTVSYTYDDFDNIIYRARAQLNSDQDSPGSAISYNWTERRLLSSASYSGSNNASIQFTYNTNRQPLKETLNEQDRLSIRTWTYDNYGRNTVLVTERSDARFSETTTTTNTFDAQGRLKNMLVSTHIEDTITELTTRTETLEHYKYNSSNLLHKIEVDINNDQSIDKLTELSRNDKGDISKALFDQDGDGTHEHAVHYTYNTSGKIISKWEGSIEPNQTGTLTLSTFDEAGKLTHTKTTPYRSGLPDETRSIQNKYQYETQAAENGLIYLIDPPQLRLYTFGE